MENPAGELSSTVSFLQNCLNHATASCTAEAGEQLIKKSGRFPLGFQASPFIF